MGAEGVPAVAVAVTSRRVKVSRAVQYAASIIVLMFVQSVAAMVLPEDRTDTMYHRYSGGGVTIDGPSVLVRAGDEKRFSGWANYYIDTVSSASIDVVTQGSPYEETRKETSVGLDYLHANTIMSLAYSNSNEDDYQANSGHFDVVQSMFGDLTTVSLGYSYAKDTVEQNEQPDFSEDVTRQNYRVGLSQILTKSLVFDLAYEAITDEGFLNNPYRSVRYADSSTPVGYSFEAERYPNTRTSHAVSGAMMYYLPYRASIRGQYRFFTDSWGINSNTVELLYTHPFKAGWTLDLGYRYYDQTGADFYSDLFPRQNAQNFLARDKELSEFTDHTIGVGLTWDFLRRGWGVLSKGSFTVKYNRIFFDYSDFRDIREQAAAPGDEPLYNFAASVWQAYLSVWY